MLRLSRRLPQISRCFRSAWISESNLNQLNQDVNVEQVFIKPDVQSLLYGITGLELENKLFRPRSIGHQQRSQYHLMTDKMISETVKEFEKRGRRFLQFVPFMEPRPRDYQVLAKDEELAHFDESKFVFTDITFDATNRDRIVVIRETDGTLRTALPDEHDRMNRVYYEQPDRPVIPPAVFKEPDLTTALRNQKYEFVMDWACYFYEPDDPDFVDLSKKVFDHILQNKDMDLLYSTRHFGSFVFYGLLNHKIAALLEFFGSKSNLDAAAQVVTLQKLMYPDWRTAVSSGDSSRQILQDFLKQNKSLAKRMPSLVALLEGKQRN